MARFWVYILRCADGTLYTGITSNLEKRISRHNSGRASKYTRARVPVRLAYAEAAAGKGEALRREVSIKKMSRGRKLLLCSSYSASSEQSVR